MSRFGIRKRLKGMISGDREVTIQRYGITFVLPEGDEQTLQVEDRYSLLMAADANGITISTGRRAGGTCPDGRCGLCRVEILDATGLTEMQAYEKKALDDHIAGTPHDGHPREPAPPATENTRLGCHTKVCGDGGRVQILALFDPESITGR